MKPAHSLLRRLLGRRVGGGRVGTLIRDTSAPRPAGAARRPRPTDAALLRCANTYAVAMDGCLGCGPLSGDKITLADGPTYQRARSAAAPAALRVIIDELEHCLTYDRLFSVVFGITFVRLIRIDVDARCVLRRLQMKVGSPTACRRPSKTLDGFALYEVVSAYLL
ncbi:hypothetical protein EVAR_101173_1 [Eumeta japonica]|uniref:Uncharacterized protein n=1 Tax=Eumeta variegata TaxID=151549 RepID=A0A4C2ADG7_EUMVA|nr:hypothetical protein EVAR_101173_1 [Eumeta japonica]